MRRKRNPLAATLRASTLLFLALAACEEAPPPGPPPRHPELITILREQQQKGTRVDSEGGAVLTLDVTLAGFFESGDGLARITLKDVEPFAQTPTDVVPPDVLSVAVENHRGYVIVSLEDLGADGYAGEDTSAIYSRLEKLTKKNLFDTFTAQLDPGRGAFLYAGVIGTVAATIEGKPLPQFAPLEEALPEPEPGTEPAAPPQDELPGPDPGAEPSAPPGA